jgi:hypothetical protein
MSNTSSTSLLSNIPMRYFLRIAVFSILICTLFSCARPCPKDIHIADLNLTTATKTFIPTGQLVDKMTFTNTATNAKLEFTNTSGNTQITRFELPVETLCERGDFLDKTTQTAYFSAETLHLYYTTTDGNYTLGVDAQPENFGLYGSRADTVMYEIFSAYGQKISEPSRTGSFRLLSSERGNSTKFDTTFRANNNMFNFVADTSIAGRPLTNVWTTPTNNGQTLFVYYTKTRGIEAFSTAEATWLRD